jgi:hypothetical protein
LRSRKKRASSRSLLEEEGEEAEEARKKWIGPRSIGFSDWLGVPVP